MKNISTIFILTGEPSGERYGAALAKALSEAIPGVKIVGVGGNRMREAGVSLIAHIHSLSVMGFTGIIRNFPRIYKIRQFVLKSIREIKPDAVILIDFPDFNLSIAKAIRGIKQLSSTKIFYFIPPQVWIWRKSRIHTIKKYCNAVFPIFQFEHKLYCQHGIPSYFFGHPISDFLPKQYDQKSAEKQESRMVVSLFPGSRNQEILKILPVMLGSVQKLNSTHPLTILINIAEDIDRDLIENIVSNYDLPVTLLPNTYQAIAEADLILSKSGTINLEVAYFEKPAIIVYKTSWLNYWIAKWFVRPKFISLINILSGSEVVKEFIQSQATIENINTEMEKIVADTSYRFGMIKRTASAKESFFTSKQNVIKEIVQEISKSI
ncbi:lipid-A-disaccharide synthase [bacterium]|nr:lipid-A-disaccharide synthase [bacterium]